MRTLIFCIVLTALALAAQSQSTADVIKNQAGEGVRQGANAVTQKTGDKITDKVLGKLFDKKKKNNNATGDNATSEQTRSNSSKDAEGNVVKNVQDDKPDFQVRSKFDFIPGDKILAYDDF